MVRTAQIIRGIRINFKDRDIQSIELDSKDSIIEALYGYHIPDSNPPTYKIDINKFKILIESSLHQEAI
jgi:hypothetical protein